MTRGTVEEERSARTRLKRLGAVIGGQLARVEDPLGAAGMTMLAWLMVSLFVRGNTASHQLLRPLMVAGMIAASIVMPGLARMGRGFWSWLWRLVKYLLRRFVSQPSALRRQVRTGDVVWTWIEYLDGPDDEGNIGKDRPVAVVDYRGSTIYVAALTSKDHTYRDDCVAIGSGPWDKSGRPSFAKVDILYKRDREQLRRVVPNALTQRQMGVILTGLRQNLGDEYLRDPEGAFRSTVDVDGVGGETQSIFGWLLIAFGILFAVISPITHFFMYDFLELFR